MVSHSKVIHNYFNASDREYCNRGSHIFFEGDTLYSYGKHFILAQRVKNGYILNGDRYSVSTSKHQSITRAEAPSNSPVIPFSALEQVVNIDKIKDIVLVDKTIEDINEEYTYKDSDGNKKTGYRHHLGASLIRYKNKYYLSSIDSGSRNHQFFLVELPRKTGIYANFYETVTEAFRALAGNLSDNDYIDYIKGNIKRQGEYFLKPSLINRCCIKPLKQVSQVNKYIHKIHLRTSELEKLITNIVLYKKNHGYINFNYHNIKELLIPVKCGNKKYIIEKRYCTDELKLPKNFIIQEGKIIEVSDKRGIIEKYDLSQGEGNSHIASRAINVSGELFISGTLRHNEHKMVRLGKQWHHVIKNTAVRSFTAVGNVD